MKEKKIMFNSFYLPVTSGYERTGKEAHLKHRHRRNVTSHHFTSLLFTSFHFYVYSNFFGSYQLKGKYNTHTHIEKLKIFHNFSSLLINWKAKTIQIYLQGYTKSSIKFLYFRHTSWQIWYTLKPRLNNKFNQCSSYDSLWYIWNKLAK